MVHQAHIKYHPFRLFPPFSNSFPPPGKKKTHRSSPEMSSAAARISTAATNISSETQTLIAEMRKALGTIKSLAVDLEKDGKSDKVQRLDEAALELLTSYDDCAAFAEAVTAVAGVYHPSDQLTDFRKLIETEVAKLKGDSPAAPQSHPLYRQFREAVWNVHHAGQPMPGEEQEDIIMTSTQSNIVNIICPLTGKPIVELTDPVRCVDCKHIYEKDPIMHYIRTQRPQAKCPAAGCPKVLQAGRVVCDSLLRIEIEELRSSERAAPNPTNVEDFTELDDDDDE